MELQAYIKVDTNDADYRDTLFDVTIEEVDKLRKIAKAIKDYSEKSGESHNFETDGHGDSKFIYVELEETLTEEEYDWFYELLPYDDFGIHTIECIEIREKPQVLDRFL